MTQKNTKMQPTKKQMKEYNEHLVRESKKFRLTVEDLGNLFDLFFMIDNPPEFNIDFRKTLKINKMDKWFYKFHERIEEIVIPELTNQQPEVLVCQGEGEMDGKSYLPKTRSTVEANESCSNLASSTQNPSADTIPKSKYINKLI